MTSQGRSASIRSGVATPRLRITKVYTRTGDKGRTKLAGGQAVWKDDHRVEAYGSIDELNAQMGFVLALLRSKKRRSRGSRELDHDLEWIQHKLFDIGSLLATAPGQTFPRMPTVEMSDVTRLERRMDACLRLLPPLTEFILPGGGLITSALHVARTVCRRAERRCVRLGRRESLSPTVTIFLNRLSDLLFVLARDHARRLREGERIWQRQSSSS